VLAAAPLLVAITEQRYAASAVKIKVDVFDAGFATPILLIAIRPPRTRQRLDQMN
jgi:hypothetical protein